VVLPGVKIADTLWAKLTDEKMLGQLDSGDLEEVFGIVQKEVKADDKDKHSNKPVAITLLDMKRSNNLSIMLSRFGKTTHQEIKDAIVKLDPAILTIESVNSLLKFVPTSEEKELFHTFDGDKNMLAQPEKFFLHLLTIPRLEERLKCFLIQKNFESKIGEYKSSLSLIKASIAEISSSKKLTGFLELTLAFGNYLNGGTPKGAAYGFKLDNLAKLPDVKSPSNPQITGMSYILELIDKKFPELSGVEEDLKTVPDAAKESLATIQGDLGKIKGELSLVEREGNNAEHNLPGDKFCSIMKGFFTSATEEYDAVDNLYKDVETKFKVLLKQFGEAQTADTTEFFTIVAQFLEALDKTKKRHYKKKTSRRESSQNSRTESSQRCSCSCSQRSGCSCRWRRAKRCIGQSH
jgi:hypothetical protein